MSNKERYRIINYRANGKPQVRYVDGLLTKANNIFNRFAEQPGKTTFEVMEVGTTTWKHVKSRG